LRKKIFFILTIDFQKYHILYYIRKLFHIMIGFTAILFTHFQGLLL